MDHSYFTDRLSAYHDSGLPVDEQEAVRLHVETCEQCLALLREYAKLDSLIEQQSEFGSDDYWEDSAQKIEAAIETGDTTKETNEETTDDKQWSTALWWKLAGVAASVAILTFVGLHKDEIIPGVGQAPSIRAIRPVTPMKLDSLRADLETDLEVAEFSTEDELVAEEKGRADVSGITRAPKMLVAEEVDAAKPVVTQRSKPSPLASPSKKELADEKLATIVVRETRSSYRGYLPPQTEIVRESATGAGENDFKLLEVWQTRRDSLTAMISSLGRGKVKTAAKMAVETSAMDNLSATDIGKTVPGTTSSISQLIVAHYNIVRLSADSTERAQSLQFLKTQAKSADSTSKAEAASYLDSLKQLNSD